MSRPSYWLSASVLTITSAPSFSAASSPAWKPFARPLLFVSRTMWSTPCSRATSIVRSVEPSSITSHSTASKPGDLAGEVAQRDGEGLLLVQAGDLDDQLHGSGGGQSYHRRRDEPPARRGPGTRRARPDHGRRASSCGSSTTTTGCPTSTTSTRARTSPSAPSRSSATPTPATSRTRRRTPTCCISLYRVLAMPIGGGEEIINGYKPTPRGCSRSSRGLAAVLCLVGRRRRSTSSGRRLWDRAHRPGRRRGALLRVPAGRVLAHRGDRRRHARARRARAALLGPHRTRADGWRWCARRRARRRAWRSASSTRPGSCCSRRRSRSRSALVARRDRARAAHRAAGRAGRRRRHARRLLRHQPVLLPRPRHRAAPAARPGRARREPGQVRPGRARPARCTTSTACCWGLGYAAGRRRRPRARCCSARRDRAAAARSSLVFPVALFLYLSVQSRFFGRWLLPVYPGARAAGRATRSCAAVEAVRARAPRLALAGARRRLPSCCCGSRSPPTRARWRCSANATRARSRATGSSSQLPARSADHHRAGRARALLLAGPQRPPAPPARATSSSTSSSARSARRTSSTAARCGPRCSTATAAAGYCTVMTFDLIRGRAEAARRPRGRSPTTRRLDRESDVVFAVSPYRADGRPAAVQLRPQLQLLLARLRAARARRSQIYRLRDCRQRYGPRRSATA